MIRVTEFVRPQELKAGAEERGEAIAPVSTGGNDCMVTEAWPKMGWRK
jgi:hypothetical protein